MLKHIKKEDENQCRMLTVQQNGTQIYAFRDGKWAKHPREFNLNPSNVWRDVFSMVKQKKKNNTNECNTRTFPNAEVRRQ